MITGSTLEKLFMNIEEVHKDGFAFNGIYVDGKLIITATEALQKQDEQPK